MPTEYIQKAYSCPYVYNSNDFCKRRCLWSVGEAKRRVTYSIYIYIYRLFHGVVASFLSEEAVIEGVIQHGEIKLEEAAVLHYTYTKFSDLTSRRDRCGCKPTKEDVKRCFMLEFDRSAFIIASTATEDEMHRWYRERIVWTDKDLNLKLMRKGLLTRIYAPMVIVQGLREAGIFTNALASGHSLLEKSMSKEQFLSSMSNSSTTNSSMASVSIKHLNNDKHKVKLGKAGEGKSQAASRKLLETSDGSFVAVPPMAPPSLDAYTEDFSKM